jgi:hypothetical protein
LLSKIDFFKSVNCEAWKILDYLDSRSAIYYYGDISEEISQELSCEIYEHEIMVSAQFGGVRWDTSEFREYRMIRWASRRDQNKMINKSYAEACDLVAHYLYRASINQLPADRLSLDERFDAVLDSNKSNK